MSSHEVTSEEWNTLDVLGDLGSLSEARKATSRSLKQYAGCPMQGLRDLLSKASEVQQACGNRISFLDDVINNLQLVILIREARGER